MSVFVWSKSSSKTWRRSAPSCDVLPSPTPKCLPTPTKNFCNHPVWALLYIAMTSLIVTLGPLLSLCEWDVFFSNFQPSYKQKFEQIIRDSCSRTAPDLDTIPSTCWSLFTTDDSSCPPHQPVEALRPTGTQRRRHPVHHAEVLWVRAPKSFPAHTRVRAWNWSVSNHTGCAIRRKFRNFLQSVKLAPLTGCTSTPWPRAFCTHCCASLPSSWASNNAGTEIKAVPPCILLSSRRLFQQSPWRQESDRTRWGPVCSCRASAIVDGIHQNRNAGRAQVVPIHKKTLHWQDLLMNAVLIMTTSFLSQVLIALFYTVVKQLLCGLAADTWSLWPNFLAQAFRHLHDPKWSLKQDLTNLASKGLRPFCLHFLFW